MDVFKYNINRELNTSLDFLFETFLREIHLSQKAQRGRRQNPMSELLSSLFILYLNHFLLKQDSTKRRKKLKRKFLS